MAAEKFAEQLRTLRTGVGNPSFRKMAGRSGRISHTTLHEAAAGTRFPSWETTREFVRACEADEAQWRCRWEDAQRPGTAHADSNGARTPVDTDSQTGAGTPDAVTARVVAAETSRAMTSAAPGGPVVSGVATSADLVPAGPRALRVAEQHLPAVQDDVGGARQHPLPWLAAAATVVVVALVAALGFAVRGRTSPGGSGAVAGSPSPSPSAFSDALIPGDSSKFVADVTIPDGTRVKVNARFEKVWALKNVGSVDWHNRFLARTNPTADDDDCQTPDRVAIGDTPPGEQVMISVVVTAPNRPGKCWVSWKMVDEHGQEFFPTRRPVYFMVTVTA
ncbi:NBR1-Ig-like domain-containing protein [Micromonospora sp. MA102]|uniref:NBR1-Ig-like domain-containing protein n=1 Tax=Micromonospora sp. MA102 TaxID=2952755 RepID=UPI0021CA4E27|nr:NBR1-Ig-like domain-containing protein [Micromonospora sp. MA102]